MDSNHPGKLRAETCVLYMAWGKEFSEEAYLSALRSPGLRGLPKILITDRESPAREDSDFKVVRVDFELAWHARKSELVKFLPPNYSNFIFLDTDTWVLDDISLGIEKAEGHGFAMVQANSYILDDYKKFHRIMEAEGVPTRSLPQHNSGVLFFSTKHEVVTSVLKDWFLLCRKYSHLKGNWRGDQPYLSLALELNNVAPYTLVRNYNYRPNRDSVFGGIRVWHMSTPPPKNVNESPMQWRRFKASRRKMVATERNLPSRRKIRRKLGRLLALFFPRKTHRTEG